MIPLYDAHNHLQDERLDRVRAEALRDLPRLGLRACVVNGTRERDWEEVAALAQEYPWIIPAFGLHPWYASERSAQWLDRLQRYLDEFPRGCVGEIGLDRWMREPDLADQKEVFVRQLEMAADRSVAACIHCLKAWGPLETVLKSHRRPSVGFLIHSYGGSAEMIPVFAKFGAYFSISGYFAQEKKATQRDVFQAVPIDRFLIETDAPDMLPPENLRAFGEKVNDPRNIAAFYKFAAQLRQLPEESLAATIQQNFQRLFKLNA